MYDSVLYLGHPVGAPTRLDLRKLNLSRSAISASLTVTPVSTMWRHPSLCARLPRFARPESLHDSIPTRLKRPPHEAARNAMEKPVCTK